MSVLPSFSPLAAAVFKALNDGGYQTRAVGGWVRQWLQQPDATEKLLRTDCDLATTATPEQALAVLHAAGLTTTDPGLRWGTVIVHGAMDDIPVEVTTLREDTYVAGSRYPTVRWTTDWATDATRRDFTFNAVYLDAAGTVDDPCDGRLDMAAGMVRFIGNPSVRLAEDPLRWLRFWRFCAHVGLAGVTPEVLQILAESAPGLASLSRPRVQQEWQKLERGVWAGSVLELWRQQGFLPLVQARLSAQ